MKGEGDVGIWGVCGSLTFEIGQRARNGQEGEFSGGRMK